MSVLDRSGERWGVDPARITDLDGHWHTGFVIITGDGPGVALSFQSGVDVPPGARWRTVRGMTNSFSAWDEVLRPYGPRVHW